MLKRTTPHRYIYVRILKVACIPGHLQEVGRCAGESLCIGMIGYIDTGVVHKNRKWYFTPATYPGCTGASPYKDAGKKHYHVSCHNPRTGKAHDCNFPRSCFKIIKKYEYDGEMNFSALSGKH